MTSMNIKLGTALLFGCISSFFMAGVLQAGITDFAALPPTQTSAADPNVMINLSIETPMQGAAYNDQPNGSLCGGRLPKENSMNIGACYSSSEKFIGIFDSNKCYTYSGSDHYFSPAGATNASYECSGQWSGNLLNWATMTAIDEFRIALTGGTRQIDTTTETVLVRANMGLRNGHSWYPVKKIDASINVAPSTVTPYSDPTIYITSYDYRIKLGSSAGASDIANNITVAAKVCDSSAGLEENCQPYGSNYKPEGLIQENALRMRFAVMSYLNDSSPDRDGGVLRANMKYVGPLMPSTTGGLMTNAETEWNESSGVFVVNPNPVDAAASGVANSGVINYINKFGANGYKSFDPVGELYYECLNYFKNRGPTPEYSAGATATHIDGFPLITNWDDPIQQSCQANYIVAINDAYPWEDKSLPGTSATSSTFYGYTWGAKTSGWHSNALDWGAPSNPDTTIDVTALTNTVGDLQGITGTIQNVGCVPGNCNMVSNGKVINELGQAFGTAPWAPKENSYYVAGLAYYARSRDIRPEASLPGQQYITTFMIDTQEYNANPLTGEMNMLWLSGKYGGFNEIDNSDTNSDGIDIEPNATVEWDEDGDGVPDNYVLANNPTKLIEGLRKAFKNISERISSGSAAAVVGNTANGNGAMVQALYQPKLNNTTKKQQVEWSGTLHGIFFDKLGHLREDNQSAGTQGRLDGYATDKVIQLFYDTSVTPKRTRVQRYDTTDGNTLTASGAPTELADLGVIWSANKLLSSLGANMGSQRPYTDVFAPAGTPRHIIAGVDQDRDGKITESEVVDFTTTDMNPYFRFMDLPDSSAATKVVNFIRGVEGIPGFRNRTIDSDNDGINEVWRLGDIIHSSPTVVGAPLENFDIIYGDTTYKNYKEHYSKRRQVAYVGGNDGMLHAFNLGFYNATNSTFELNPGGETNHPLGAEMWAYVPGNLLPHLQWLTDLEYPHIYYVDGPVQQFDVNIFTPDSTHIDGWGTIIVAGMRFGGGEIDLDTDGDGTDDYTTRSSYIILDVTDPESPPVLLAEITDSALGFTTSLPTVYTARKPGSGTDWANPTVNISALVFGSGPTELSTAESTQNSGLYLYDLINQTFPAGFKPLNLNISDSFVGNIAAKDWNNDWIDDSLYFGLTEDVITNTEGRLMQYVPGATAASTLIDTPAGQSITGRPTFATDERGNGWVYFGTGRLFAKYDNQTTFQHALYGIKDPLYTKGTLGGSGSLTLSNLQETSGVKVFSDRTLSDPGGVISPALTSNTFDALQNRIASKEGWFRNFSNATPTERSFTNPKYFLGFLLSTSYQPNSDICSPEGQSYLSALYYKTGTAFPDAGLGSPSTGSNPETEPKVNLGQGVASDLTIITDGRGNGKPTVSSNMSTGSVIGIKVKPPVAPSGRQSWTEIEL